MADDERGPIYGLQMAVEWLAREHPKAFTARVSAGPGRAKGSGALARLLADPELMEGIRSGKVTRHEAGQRLGVSYAQAYNVIRKAFGSEKLPHGAYRTGFTDRNQWIVEQLEANRTLEDIAQELGITRERVRQIGARAGAKAWGSPDKARVRREARLQAQAARRADKQARFARARELVEVHGKSIRQALIEVGLGRYIAGRSTGFSHVTKGWKTKHGRHRMAPLRPQIVSMWKAGAPRELIRLRLEVGDVAITTALLKAGIDPKAPRS